MKFGLNIPRTMLGALGISGLILGLGLTYSSFAAPLLILIDGQERVVRTHSRTVEKALLDARIQIQDGDQVFPALDQPIDDIEVIEIRRARQLLLVMDDQRVEINSAASTLADILNDGGVSLFPSDRIWVNGIPASDLTQQLPFFPRQIRLLQGHAITLEIDGDVTLIRSSAPTLGEALAEAGIYLFEGDILRPEASTPFAGIQTVSLVRSRDTTIRIGLQQIRTRLAANSIGEALAEVDLALLGADYSIPSASSPLPEDGMIEVIRVSEEVILEQTPIAFETVYYPNPELEIDSQSVVEGGSFGVLASRVRIRKEQGVEVARVVEDEWEMRSPEPRRIGYGTVITIRSINTSDGPLEYWRAVRMYATSYSPSRAGVPDDYEYFGITACGKQLVKGLVAIDRRYIPFYTRMYVPGYGYAEACDTGGGVKGRWIDLGYDDSNYEPWHQYVMVYFLTPVPPLDTIAWVFP
ncbi:MAG: DUF348 domain-containing protein [Chloroflexi bacterium]|nr:DUF348 domain-containing protein [Chloroflexota bacterium]